MNTLIIIAAVIINLIVLYVIIGSATRSKFIARHLKIQTNLLAKMAEKQGVPKEEIEAIGKFDV